VSAEGALHRLGESTAAMVEAALQRFGAEDGAKLARRGDVAVPASVEEAIDGVVLPVVAADVSYVDGVTGGNVFLLPVEGARRLAATMMGQEPDALEPSGELGDLELSAIGEAMNQMMSAAAMATTGLLRQQVDIAPPQIRVLRTAAEAIAMLRAAAAPHVLTVEFTVAGTPSRLVQLVPNAFVVKMDRALDGFAAEYPSAPLGDSLRAVPVRVWAELGRARMPAGASLDLPPGAVIELDKDVDEPVDLYVDGMHLASGRLLVAADGSLQLQVDAVVGLQDGPLAADYSPQTAMNDFASPPQPESTEV
jgi:flagellar motor switch protein FliN